MERQRVALVWATLAVAALFGVMALADDASPVEFRAVSDADPASVELDALLRAVDAAWQPRLREAVLADARAQRDRYVRPLQALLAQRHHPALLRAIDLAGVLELAELAPILVDLAMNGSPEVRPRAIVAAARITPLERSAVHELLDDPDPAIVTAALSTLTANDGVPWFLVVRLFEHDDETIRTAALAALPKPVPEEVLGPLQMLLLDTDLGRIELAIRALSSTDPTPEVEEMLTRQLEHSDPAIRLLTLEALASKSGPVRDPEPIWSLALTATSPNELARALALLESTDEFDAAELGRMLPAMHPLPRYFAARCLLRNGDLNALSALVDLTESPPAKFGDVDPAAAEAVKRSAAMILADLAGTSPYAGAAEWRRWILGTDELGAVVLAEPPVVLQ